MFILIVKCVLVKPCQNIFAVRSASHIDSAVRTQTKEKRLNLRKMVILKTDDGTCSPNRYLLFSK